MGQVIVRNLDDAVIETHRKRAKARGVSLEQELRERARAGSAAEPRGAAAARAGDRRHDARAAGRTGADAC